MGKLLRTYTHIITSPYGKRGDSWHGGVDITGYKNGTHFFCDLFHRRAPLPIST